MILEMAKAEIEALVMVEVVARKLVEAMEKKYWEDLGEELLALRDALDALDEVRNMPPEEFDEDKIPF